MSPKTLEQAVWKNRWMALKEHIAYWQTNLKTQSQPQIERQVTLTQLLANLENFGESQMNFFLKGLGDEPTYRLEPSAEYPWDYVFRTTIDQISYDLDVLVRAIQQRMPHNGPPAARKTLALADQLAYQALLPALEHRLVDSDTTVVTYFQKSVNVRLIPYGPVFLIGIPVSAIRNPRDLLAIPHEVGHYVFRDGRVRNGRFADSRFSATLYSRYARQPDWFNLWLEEIFADIYGCLIAGPVIALSFMGLVTDDPVSEFTQMDDEHPISAVRPHSYFGTLRRMRAPDQGKKGSYFAESLAKLQSHWQELFNERGAPATLQLGPTADPIRTQELIKTLDEEVVDLILQDQFLGKLLPRSKQDLAQLWSSELSADQPLDALYQQFECYAEMLMAKAKPLPELPAGPGNQGETGLWHDAIRMAGTQTRGNNDPVFVVPADIWGSLLTAGGWAVEGPPGGNLHS
jgi:hypothetical protein